ncbi:MAG: hypothetical protein FRX49_04450 [Trebouxia sp. A1-2]|nr:MAG: hypothetical protein FRX49_04450 [Trebouxia sp. A1-2]
MLGLAEGPGLAALRPAGFGTSGAVQANITLAAGMCLSHILLPLKFHQTYKARQALRTRKLLVVMQSSSARMDSQDSLRVMVAACLRTMCKMVRCMLKPSLRSASDTAGTVRSPSATASQQSVAMPLNS